MNVTFRRISAVLFLLVAAIFKMAEGHGRLVEPPSRSSMWRFGFKNPTNYNDNQLFCGGKSIQWDTNNGKCGVCGDRYDGKRENEVGGKYANGIIVRKYSPGETIPVTVHITASHKGWFEFRICENKNPSARVTQECMDQNILYIKEAASTRWSFDFTRAFKKTFQVVLPKNLRCSACVLQWKYNTGNSWGVDETGKGCVGCGPQEQFYGCADVAIGHDDVALGQANVVPVIVPDGDVDERTYTGGDTEGQTGTCHCPCANGARYIGQYILTILLLIICAKTVW